MDIGQLFELTISLRFLSEKMRKSENTSEKRSIAGELREKILQLLERISRACETHETESLEDLFVLFENILESHQLETIFDGSNEFLILVYSQKAHVLQSLGRFDQLTETLAKIEGFYLTVLGGDTPTAKSLSVPNLHFPGQQQLFGNRVLDLIRFSLNLAQVHLQQTAVFSQMNSHLRALECAEKATTLLFIIINRFGVVFKHLREFGVPSAETIDAFNGQISDFACFFDFLESTSTQYQEFQQVEKMPDVFWRPANDQSLKQLLTRIQLQKQTRPPPSKLHMEDFTTFHISSLVKVQPFHEAVQILEQTKFNEQLLNRTILILASSIFSVATENRFLSFLEIQKDLQEYSANCPDESRRKCETVTKESKLHANKRFILSEKIHTLSIEILAFGYPEHIKLLSHFYQSYKKNYSVDIFVIEEEDEQSFTTIRTSAKHDDKKTWEDKNQKYIRIFPKQDYFADLRKKNGNENVFTNANSNSPFKDFRKKPRKVDNEGVVKPRYLPLSINPSRDPDSVSLHLSSVDRFKNTWRGDNQKAQPVQLVQPISQVAFKKNKAEGYLTFLNKQKDDFLAMCKQPSKDKAGLLEQPNSSKTLQKYQSVKTTKKGKPKDASLRRKKRSVSREHSVSFDFLKSVQPAPTLVSEMKLGSRKFEVRQKKHFDRLGFLSSKFSSLITENQKDFKAKYQDKIKEKVNNHNASCYITRQG